MENEVTQSALSAQYSLKSAAPMPEPKRDTIEKLLNENMGGLKDLVQLSESLGASMLGPKSEVSPEPGCKSAVSPTGFLDAIIDSQRQIASLINEVNQTLQSIN